MTFSIVARCPRTGMLGVATSSKALAAGGMVPYCRAGVGAIASQSFVNPYLGIEGITLLEQGLPAARVLERNLWRLVKGHCAHGGTGWLHGDRQRRRGSGLESNGARRSAD